MLTCVTGLGGVLVLTKVTPERYTTTAGACNCFMNDRRKFLTLAPVQGTIATPDRTVDLVCTMLAEYGLAVLAVGLSHWPRVTQIIGPLAALGGAVQLLDVGSYE